MKQDWQHTVDSYNQVILFTAGKLLDIRAPNEVPYHIWPIVTNQVNFTVCRILIDHTSYINT